MIRLVDGKPHFTDPDISVGEICDALAELDVSDEGCNRANAMRERFGLAPAQCWFAQGFMAHGVGPMLEKLGRDMARHYRADCCTKMLTDRLSLKHSATAYACWRAFGYVTARKLEREAQRGQKKST